MHDANDVFGTVVQGHRVIHSQCSMADSYESITRRERRKYKHYRMLALQCSHAKM